MSYAYYRHYNEHSIHPSILDIDHAPLGQSIYK